MNYQTFFLVSLFLPAIVFGLFELGFAISGAAFTKSLPEFLVSFWLNTKLAIPFASIQYIALAGLMFRGIGRWSLRSTKIHAALLPVYYAVVLLLTLFVYGEVKSDSSVMQVAMISAFAAIIYGYVYVLFVFATYFGGRKSGAIQI